MPVRHAIAAAFGALLACALPVALAQEPPQDFAQAKAMADADEASLDEAARAGALARQRAFLDASVAACADAGAGADLEAFTIVVRLDEAGNVARTWRRGDSPLALCIERRARGQAMFVPPRAPFHASLEVSFVP